ncbi:hypothetical protein RND81_09G124600 [Saponaria officinalis]|uniref:Uncharacterized protein n=1 Tax=Saponaria officinalis TaxID=3572 RepID=A0AAW1IL93_SAPOF
MLQLRSNGISSTSWSSERAFGLLFRGGYPIETSSLCWKEVRSSVIADSIGFNRTGQELQDLFKASILIISVISLFLVRAQKRMSRSQATTQKGRHEGPATGQCKGIYEFGQQNWKHDRRTTVRVFKLREAQVVSLAVE